MTAETNHLYLTGTRILRQPHFIKLRYSGSVQTSRVIKDVCEKKKKTRATEKEKKRRKQRAGNPGPPALGGQSIGDRSVGQKDVFREDMTMVVI